MPVQGQKFVVVGGAGLVGSAVSHALISQYAAAIVVCDNFGSVNNNKWAHLPTEIDDIWTPDSLLVNLEKSWREIAGVVLLADDGHSNQDCDALFEAAFHLPRRVWDYCVTKQRPLYWASSSHVYGAGPSCLSADPSEMAALLPLTAFGRAKLAFDVFAARQGRGPNTPPVWGGYRLSSVYGPHEAHKGELASLPVKAMAAAKNETELMLCDQIDRDWVHVDDAATALAGLIIGEHAGYFDIGTGTTTTQAQLTSAVETVSGKTLKRVLDTTPNRAIKSLSPANITPLADVGLPVQFRSLEQGLADL